MKTKERLTKEMITRRKEIDEMRSNSRCTTKYFELTEKEQFSFIRGVLHQDGKRLRFDMTGFDDEEMGYICKDYNDSILNRFSFLGLNDQVYLNLYFYKGHPIVEVETIDFGFVEILDLGGLTTAEIIHAILIIINGQRTLKLHKI